MINKKSPSVFTKELNSNVQCSQYSSDLDLRQRINLLFKDRAIDILKELFGDIPIVQNDNEIRVGNKGSLAITILPDKIIYYSHENDQGGDVFDLVQYALKCDFKTAINWSKFFLGLSLYKVDITTQNFNITPKKDERQKVTEALKIWNGSVPIKGSWAEVYLNKRGITFKDENYIKLHPSLWNFTVRIKMVRSIRPISRNAIANSF
jgi:hypothetical protein